jgi:hypothetical protein
MYANRGLPQNGMPVMGMDPRLEHPYTERGDLAGYFTDPYTGVVYDGYTKSMPEPLVMREQPMIQLGQPSRMLEALTGVSAVARPPRREVMNDFSTILEGINIPQGLLNAEVQRETAQRAAPDLLMTNRESVAGFNDTHWDGYVGDTYVMRPVIDTQTVSDNDETNTVLAAFRARPDLAASGFQLAGADDPTRWGGSMQPGVTVLAQDRTWATGRGNRDDLVHLGEHVGARHPTHYESGLGGIETTGALRTPMTGREDDFGHRLSLPSAEGRPQFERGLVGTSRTMGLDDDVMPYRVSGLPPSDDGMRRDGDVAAGGGRNRAPDMDFDVVQPGGRAGARDGGRGWDDGSSFAGRHDAVDIYGAGAGVPGGFSLPSAGREGRQRDAWARGDGRTDAVDVYGDMGGAGGAWRGTHSVSSRHHRDDEVRDGRHGSSAHVNDDYFRLNVAGAGAADGRARDRDAWVGADRRASAAQVDLYGGDLMNTGPGSSRRDALPGRDLDVSRRSGATVPENPTFRLGSVGSRVGRDSNTAAVEQPWGFMDDVGRGGGAPSRMHLSNGGAADSSRAWRDSDVHGGRGADLRDPDLDTRLPAAFAPQARDSLRERDRDLEPGSLGAGGSRYADFQFKLGSSAGLLPTARDPARHRDADVARRAGTTAPENPTYRFSTASARAARDADLYTGTRHGVDDAYLPGDGGPGRLSLNSVSERGGPRTGDAQAARHSGQHRDAEVPYRSMETGQDGRGGEDDRVRLHNVQYQPMDVGARSHAIGPDRVGKTRGEAPPRVSNDMTLFWTGQQSFGHDLRLPQKSEMDNYEDARDDFGPRTGHGAMLRDVIMRAHPSSRGEGAEFRNTYKTSLRKGVHEVNLETARADVHPHRAARETAIKAQLQRADAAQANPHSSMASTMEAYESDVYASDV